MKIDIEGCEYRLLDEIINYQDSLSGIVIEFHNADIHVDHIKNFISKTKLILVHFHANNACGIRNHKNIKIPNIFECTFINKKYYNEPFKLNDEKIPSSIDMPNVLNVSEININYPPFVFRKHI